MICPDCKHEKIRFGIYKCKVCREAYLKEWRQQNRTHLNKWSKAWVAKNKEKRKEVVKRYESKDRLNRLMKRRQSYADGRRKKDYKQDPLMKRECKNRRRARLANVPTEKYSAKLIFEKFNWTCVYCLQPATHLDHVIPISKGGPDTESNLVTACVTCNTSKGNKTLGEWLNMKLGL